MGNRLGQHVCNDRGIVSCFDVSIEFYLFLQMKRHVFLKTGECERSFVVVPLRVSVRFGVFNGAESRESQLFKEVINF